MSESSAVSSCPVCKSAQTQPYVEKDGYAFLKCDSCGYIYCYPRPSQAELGAFYANTGGSEGINKDFYPKASSRKRRGFMNAVKLLPHVWRRRALDLGCGGGFVSGGFKAMGATESVGIDINPSAIDYAQKNFPTCTFQAGTFDDFSDGKIGKFGFVYSSEVIEHVEDVEAFMTFLVGVTEPGAKVFITTPDIAAPTIGDDVTAWAMFSPPVHIQFFNQATLVHLFGRYGFTPIKRTSDLGGEGLKMLFRKVT